MVKKYRRAEFMSQNADDSVNKTYKTLRIWHKPSQRGALHGEFFSHATIFFYLVKSS